MVESKKYRGVRQRHWGTWVSEIRHPLLKKRIWLGTFETAKEAAKAYDKASIIMNGRNAKTKFSTSQDLNDEITNNNNNININVWHTKLRKSNVSPSLTCLKLDNESNHIGVWQTGAGTKSDSKWVMTVNLHKCKGVGDDKTLASTT